MTKRVQLIGLALCLALLLGVYWYINRPEQQRDNSTVIQDVRFWDLSESDIAILAIDGPNQLAISYADGRWEVAGLDPEHTDESQVATVVRRFATLEASHQIDHKSSDLSMYGLDQPSTVVRAQLADGSEKVVYLGDRHPTEYLFYAQIEGDQKVYAVNGMYGTAFQSKMEDFCTRELVDIDLSDLKYLLIRSPGQAPVEIARSEETSVHLQGIDRLRMLSPFKTPKRVAHLDNLASFTLDSGPILTLRAREFIDLNPTDLSQYGLDQPQGELAVADSDDSVHLLFGADRNDTEVYAMVDGGSAVFSIYKNLIRIRNANPYEWLNKFLYMASIEDVRQLGLTWEDQHYRLDIEKKEVAVADPGSEDSADAEPKTELKQMFYINGMEAEERPFRRLYGTIVGLTVDAVIDREVSAAEPEVIIVYHHNDPEVPPFTIELLPYTRDLYAVRIEGVVEFVIAEEKMDKAKEELAARAAELQP